MKSEKESNVLQKESILEKREFDFGHEPGQSTRLQMIARTKNGIAVTFWKRDGSIDSSWEYDIELGLALRLFTYVVTAQSIGKKFNELFMESRKPIYAGKKITISEGSKD